MLVRYFIVLSIFPSLILAYCDKFNLIKGKKIFYKACCDGYKSIGITASKPNCVPICLEDCGNGLCSSPYTCSCNEGYDNIEHLPSNRCVPACKRGCNNGECVAPETCHCNEGYKLDESTGRCVPFCSSGCLNGHCESPGICNCLEGYVKEKEESDSGCQPVCETECGMNTTCVAPNKCDCSEGYVNFDSQCRLKMEVYNILKEKQPHNSLISFIKSWMTELAVGLVAVIVLSIGVGILISRHNYRKYEVAKRNKQQPLTVWDNEDDSQHTEYLVS